jgi:hypothetical protein
MTEAEHNWPIPKLFDNRPSALAAEVFCETIGLVIYIQNIPIIVSFSFKIQQSASASVIGQRPNFTTANYSASADCENCSFGHCLF